MAYVKGKKDRAVGLRNMPIPFVLNGDKPSIQPIESSCKLGQTECTFVLEGGGGIRINSSQKSTSL